MDDIVFDNSKYSVVLYRGYDGEGVQVFFYLCVSEDDLIPFMDQVKNGEVEVGEYCVPLFYGEGDPTPEFMADVEKRLNFSHADMLQVDKR